MPIRLIPMTEPLEYDVVVIGAGPVGENVVDRTRAAGLSTSSLIVRMPCQVTWSSGEVSAGSAIQGAVLPELTVFPDGRGIVKGTQDPAVARSLYARYIGG